MTNTNHQLIGNGAAFDDDGERLFSNTTSGMGRALCSCGWLSEPTEYGRGRKKLHADHKDEQRLGDNIVEVTEATQDDDYVTEELDKLFGVTAEDPLPDEELDELIEEIHQIVEGQTHEALETAEKGSEQAFPVKWPESVARLFWRALAKDGSDIFARAVGARRESNESKGELLIIGPAIVAMDLAERLSTVFVSAEVSLKQWRKTSPEYKRHDLKTSDGRRTAFAEEQDFLRAFCSAVAGNENADTYHRTGHEAGLHFKCLKELL